MERREEKLISGLCYRIQKRKKKEVVDEKECFYYFTTIGNEKRAATDFYEISDDNDVTRRF